MTQNLGTGLLCVCVSITQKKIGRKDGPERFEIIINDDTEHGQAIQCQTDASIINNTNIQIPRVDTKISLVEFSDRF